MWLDVVPRWSLLPRLFPRSYPVMLNAKEKEIAKRVCLTFKQNVCGFDLLRSEGR